MVCVCGSSGPADEPSAPWWPSEPIRQDRNQTPACTSTTRHLPVPALRCSHLVNTHTHNTHTHALTHAHTHTHTLHWKLECSVLNRNESWVLHAAGHCLKTFSCFSKRQVSPSRSSQPDYTDSYYKKWTRGRNKVRKKSR